MTVRPMRRGRMLAALAAAVVGIAATVGACGSSGPRQAAPTTTSTSIGSPSTTATTATTAVNPGSTTTAPAPARLVDVRVYFLRGDKIDVAHRSVASTPAVAAAAMTELLRGPSTDEKAADFASAIPAGTRLLGVSIQDRHAAVDLSGTFATGGGSLSMSARLAQVTFTLTQFPSVDDVVFRLDGQAVTVFGGEGIVLDHPVGRGSFEALTPPILVEQPARGSTAQSPLRISGSANVFEAQFQAEITDSAGLVLARQNVRATAGTGTRGTFEVTMRFDERTGGPALLTVFDTSQKDGSRIDVVEIPLQLVAR